MPKSKTVKLRKESTYGTSTNGYTWNLPYKYVSQESVNTGDLATVDEPTYVGYWDSSYTIHEKNNYDHIISAVKKSLGFERVLEKCPACGQWGAVMCACPHCGHPIDPKE